MSYVHYWPVGTVNDIRLPLTRAQICRDLLADWLPTLPFSASRSVLGWPYYLITAETGVTFPYLYLERVAGWSDRQWKGVLSWMLGIAGTRGVLHNEGYVWTAPSSAFYPERRQNVASPLWHTSYPPSALQILSNPANRSRLRPDYIAARVSASGSTEFSLVESKGTSSALNSINTCPRDWALQARNAIVQLNGSVISIPRHLVVATRCNPNAVRPKTRRLQIRAWNSNDDPPSVEQDVLLEVASACYAGLCRNLGLWDNLRALQIAALSRANVENVSDTHFAQIEEKADAELVQRGKWDISRDSPANFEIQLEVGIIHVKVTELAISIIRFIRSRDSFNGQAQVMDHHLHNLTDWYSGLPNDLIEDTDIAIDRSGFIVKAGDMRSQTRL